MKTKDVSQWVEVDAPSSPVDSILVEISPELIPGRDHVAMMDTEEVELVAAKVPS